MRSIERTLLGWVVGALALGALVVTLATYLVLLEELNEVFDADLRNVARAVAIYDHSDIAAAPAPDGVPPHSVDPPDASLLVTQTWTRVGRRVHSSDARVALPFSAIEGLSHPQVANEEWIVYTAVDSDGVVQAAQRASARRALARESSSKVLPPLLGLMVAVGGLLVFALRRGLEPLDATARDIGARSVEALEPIADRAVPREIAPLVASINELMRRLSDALTRQRRFLADAAHELRTPMTALRLQLQLLRQSTEPRSRDRAIDELASGIDRSQHLIEQLLQVARSEPDGEPLRAAPVDLAGLARAVVADLSPKADHCGIDLGATGPRGLVVSGDDQQLTILLNNLVENALRYTPRGGVVDVEAFRDAGHCALRVVDNGPGIAPAEIERVFDRFYRGRDAPAQAREAGGSGLGLAIVRAIAERHGAQVSLHRATDGAGLEVRVVFAAARSGPGNPA